tara:strand:- start:138 stop:605 length:468 start_codon:yes stop_codon:yes gene_type:complete
MLLVKVTNNTVQQYPYSVGLLRKDNPSTSFPKKVSTDVLAAFNTYPVTEVTPVVTETQKLVKTWTPTLVGGEWVLAHAAVDLTVEETIAATDVLAANAREKRNRLLAATDWVVTRARELGQPVPSDVYTYRGDLRQIPEQDGFPEIIEWPELETL